MGRTFLAAQRFDVGRISPCGTTAIEALSGANAGCAAGRDDPDDEDYPAVPLLRPLSVEIGSTTINTTSYAFRPPLVAAMVHGDRRRRRPCRGWQACQPTQKRVTRFKLPSDTVKLVDRLYYLLQPSLETLIQEGDLRFPFRPFPYQLEGVAFLYPRVAAVLADEMGLGKTMQAITAVRLLLHAGEIRSALVLVCPKPLVSNWQREFGQWAPEVPLAAEDQPKRERQWRLADVPVKIANYELLMRDREINRSHAP